METKDKTVEKVINRFLERSDLGQRKYNTTLDKNNLPLAEWLRHSIEEKMDDILYMQRALDEITKRDEQLVSEMLDCIKVK